MRRACPCTSAKLLVNYAGSGLANAFWAIAPSNRCFALIDFVAHPITRIRHITTGRWRIQKILTPTSYNTKDNPIKDIES